MGAMHLSVTFATRKLEKQRCVKLVVYKPGLDLVSDAIASHGFWEIMQPFPLAPQSSTIGRRRPFLLDLGGNIGYHSLLFAMHGYDVVTVEPMPANRRVLAASLCLHPQLAHRITVVPVALVSPRANASACVLISRGANLGNGELRCGATLPIDCKSPTNRHRRFLGYHRAAERGGAHGACEVVPTRLLDGVLAQLKSVPDVIDVVKIECATPARTEDLLPFMVPFSPNPRPRAAWREANATRWTVGLACLRDSGLVLSMWRRKSRR